MNGCHASDVTSTADTKVDEMTPSVRVPERFAQTVVAHLIKNVAPTVPMGTDLILGIHGPPGFGKTYQTNALMHLLGADIHEMSVGSFEAADAGGPVRTLRKTYESASDRIRDGHPAPQVVVLHDLDAAIGDWGPLVQTTMNRQLIFGELMQIADSPDRVAGFECTRVPIIATGNDLGRLYPPLLRPGRMRLFTWQPMPREMVEVVQGIYPWLSREDITQLTYACPGEPVAFFAGLSGWLIDSSIAALIRSEGVSPQRLLADVKAGRIPLVSRNWPLQQLLDAAKEYKDQQSGRYIQTLSEYDEEGTSHG